MLSRLLVEKENDSENMNDKYLRDINNSRKRHHSHHAFLVLLHALQAIFFTGQVGSRSRGFDWSRSLLQGHGRFHFNPNRSSLQQDAVSPCSTD